jgi:hypothetical protein
MTNEQLMIAIGVPIVFNFGMFALFFTLINNNINVRFSDFREDIDRRMRNMESELKELRRDLFLPQKKVN